MRATDKERTISPFWKSRPAAQSKKQNHFEPKAFIVGSSYSHAGIHSLSSHSRTPSGVGTTLKTTESVFHRPYSSLLEADEGHNPESEDDEDDIVYENDDEDEFGLPSIASIRKKPDFASRNYAPSTSSAREHGNVDPLIGSPTAPNLRLRSNSSDIAEERGIPLYPSANKNEGKILRPQYKEILHDPANILHLIDHSPTLVDSTKQFSSHSARINRINKFKRILQSSTVSLPDLRALAWSGIPDEVRAMTWQLLLGYLPANSERRVVALERKRKEYLDGVRQVFDRVPTDKTEILRSGRGNRGLDKAIWHQISIDIPRTSPHIPLYGYEATQRSLERILYLWAIRHPASGYVQGINDLVTPFWQVFLSTYITDLNIERGMDPGQLPRSVIDATEADSFWCLSKLLEGIQDNYIYAQPGIHRQVEALRDLTMRIDLVLVKHLEKEGVEFMQFSFRWMNCLLMREVSIQNTIRMWDTYMAEEDGFSRFHIYVCAALLVKWSDKLLTMDFQGIMMFLQSLPTHDWTEKDIELLLSEAFIWQSLFQDSSAHLRNSESSMTPHR